jgi:hypothetical protein
METAMNDERIWEFERSLWTAYAEQYDHTISDDALMVVPAKPYVLHGRQAADAMAETPRWESVEFAEQRVARPDGPDGGLIVIAYRADAMRGDIVYTAYCTSTLRREGAHDWVVLQHQQTPPLTGTS